MGLMFFLSVGGWGPRASRRIVTAWESDGGGPHRQVYSAEAGLDAAASALVGEAALAAAREAVERLAASGARTIEQVRAAVCSRRESGGTP